MAERLVTMCDTESMTLTVRFSRGLYAVDARRLVVLEKKIALISFVSWSTQMLVLLTEQSLTGEKTLK